MIRSLAFGLALVLGACATAPSAPPAASGLSTTTARPDGAVIDRYDEQAVRSIAMELGYTPLDGRINSAGKPAMSVEAGAVAFEVTGESCQGEPRVCQGVQFSAQFVDRSDIDAEELIARANRTLRPAKLFRAGEGVVYERYLIMDGGVSRENLKTEMTVYVEILRVLFDQFNPGAPGEEKP